MEEIYLQTAYNEIVVINNRNNPSKVYIRNMELLAGKHDVQGIMIPWSTNPVFIAWLRHESSTDGYYVEEDYIIYNDKYTKEYWELAVLLNKIANL